MQFKEILIFYQQLPFFSIFKYCCITISYLNLSVFQKFPLLYLLICKVNFVQLWTYLNFELKNWFKIKTFIRLWFYFDFFFTWNCKILRHFLLRLTIRSNWNYCVKIFTKIKKYSETQPFKEAYQWYLKIIIEENTNLKF